MIPVEAVEQFTRNPPGRLRTKSPVWRVYNARSTLLSVEIEVRVREGQQERLIEKLQEVQRENRHTFSGTMARYILKDTALFTNVSIWLIWKDTEMPDIATRERDLVAFKAEFDNVLDWVTAKMTSKEGIIYT